MSRWHLSSLLSSTLTFSDPSDRLHAARVYGPRHLSLRSAARILGITPQQLSGLELGRLTLPPEQWAEMIAQLTAAVKARA